jgi:hypothetical protein
MESETPKMLAGIDLIRRTGAIEFRVGYTDFEDGEPVVWYACVTYLNNMSEAAAALDPEKAVLRLCERLVDGGECAHCTRPTIFEENFEDISFYELILDLIGSSTSFCVYAWDPELGIFRRGCE